MELPAPERPFYKRLTEEQVALAERMVTALPENEDGAGVT
jgi:hypothetical protein